MSEAKAAISVLNEILAWSGARPLWQRDALRRIISSGTLSGADISQLNEICRNKGENAVSLDTSHIPSGTNSQDSVALYSLGSLIGVNRIPTSEKIVFGSAPGLTVIYGDNGVGKSGYARVLKKACRARDSIGAIHPDAYFQGPPVQQSAEIEYSVGGKKCQPVTWTDKLQDKHLGNIFFFDSRCASNYLASASAASFTPYGLDILPKLSQVCDEIKKLIDSDIAVSKREIALASATWVIDETEAGKLLHNLSAMTTTAEVDKQAVFSDADRKRLAELASLLKINSKQKAAQTRASANRLKAFLEKLKATLGILSPEAIKQFKTKAEAKESTAKGAKEFGEKSVDSEDITSTGSEAWKALWAAAKKFSEEDVYAGKAFPVLDEDSLCVLCQQPITPAIGRMKRFEELVENALQKAADAAENEFKEVYDLFVDNKSNADDLANVDADLIIATPEQLEVIQAWIQSCDNVRKSTTSALEKGVWGEPIDLPTYPGPTIQGLVDKLTSRAAEEESADDPVSRKKLQAEHDKLNSHKWLSENRNAVIDQISRYKRLVLLENALNDINTKAITAKNNELTKAVVETPFCDRFSEETKLLGLQTVSVKLENVGGRKGETKFGLKFERQSNLPLNEVASEGEQRAIALAAFLAELSQASHQSALIFDDPVCSLDHYHRLSVASRLAQEGLTRQVIVFTHDTIFLNDLVSEAEKAKVTSKTLHLSWNGAEPGHVHDGLPWDHEKPKQRIHVLKANANQLTKTWSVKPSDSDTANIRNLYSRFRATLERVLEQIVFNDVLMRDRTQIKTGYLDGLVGFSQDECDEYMRLIQKCHDVTDAHDPSSGKQARIPTPSEFLQDIADAESVIQKTMERKKTT